MPHTGTLQPGDSYTGTLTTNMPSVTPGQYHIIVRTDIYNQLQLPPGVPISSKTTASAGLLDGRGGQPDPGRPVRHHASSTGQERLLQVTVPAGGDAARSRSAPIASGAANEIFIKQGAAPTDSVYDAAYQGGLAPTSGRDHPLHRFPGVYYILIRGHSEPADDTPVSVLAELLPLSITNVRPTREVTASTSPPRSAAPSSSPMRSSSW